VRSTFSAQFECYGRTQHHGNPKRYMLIQDIRDANGKYVAQHCWMPLRKDDTVSVQLERGDVIQFSAEVELYTKGTHRKRRVDYGLCRPRSVEKVQVQEEMQA
jgi:hypothetical protein